VTGLEVWALVTVWASPNWGVWNAADTALLWLYRQQVVRSKYRCAIVPTN